MLLGRISGWIFLILAMVMASAEAVLALGTGAYSGLATVDLWTLLVGQSPSFDSSSQSIHMLALIGEGIMQMPAWVVVGALGFILAHMFRKRRTRRRVFVRA